MSGSVNKVTLIGRLGADPETRSMQNGGQVVNMRLATSESWKDKNTGEKREKTEWHTVTIFDENIGRVASAYLKKGSQCYLEGQLQTRKWQDQNGNDRYSTEVVLQKFRGQLVLLDPKQARPMSDEEASADTSDWQRPVGGSGTMADEGDSIPFAPEWR